MCENRLRRICGRKKYRAVDLSTRLETLHDNTLVEYRACMEGMVNASSIRSENRKRSDYVGDLGVEGGCY